MENHEVAQISLEVYISARDSTGGTIDIVGTGWTQEFSVSSDFTTRIILPTNLAMANGSGIIRTQAVHITSNDIISVYALNSRSVSADATVVLPVTSLGNEYFVTAHREPDGGGPSLFSEFMIVAVEDNTQISINPSATTLDGKPAEIPYGVDLDAGDVYQVQSSVGDLTGSKIIAIDMANCKNFAVFGGNEWTRIGQCGPFQDHLFEQMYPVSTWGRNFTLVPLLTRLGGDIYKFLAAEDSTQILMDGRLLTTRNSGKFSQRLISGTHTITANKPISVAQFSRSQNCDNVTGDPFMIMLSPDEQMLDRITFNALQVTVIENYYLNIITKTSSLDLLNLDAAIISGEFNQVAGNPALSFAQLEIEAGNHTLSSDSGFIAYVYGYGNIESFGYATGVSLKNLNLEVLPINTSTGDLITSGGICRGLEILFSVNAADELQFFDWDFGDGTTASGDSVTHVYDQEGDYFVKVEGFSSDGGSCESQQSSTVQIPVIIPAAKILGPLSVCPDVTEIDYTITGDADDNQYQWFVEGGVFDGNDTGDSVKINWGPTNDNASISILPSSSEGCVGDTTIAVVKINVRLEPLIPQGVDSLCSSDITEIPYSTFFSNGSIYDWSISGGSFANGDTTNSISVIWDGPGIGSLWYEESSIQDDVCAGVSDTLTVFIEPVPDTVLTLISSKEIVQVGEKLEFEILGDGQFNFYSWDFEDGTAQDSLAGIIQMDHIFDCPGTYPVNVSAFTGTLCPQLGNGNKPITVLGPEIEMVNVTYLPEESTTIAINWKTINSDHFDTEATIQRRQVFPEQSEWSQVGNTAILAHTFSETGLDSAIYEYQIFATVGCQTVETKIHNNILIITEVDDDSETTFMEWNPYINWQAGVEHYEVWLKIDNNDQELLQTFPGNNLEFAYRNDGFNYCFRINAIENSGNQSNSWSSIACVEFSPRVDNYNVFTPNGDEYNPTLVFDGIELFPNNELKVVNRYGKRVFSAIPYQNDWDGKSLASGVYYYVLDLKDPRAQQPLIKGIVSILR